MIPIKNIYDPHTDTRFKQQKNGEYTLSDEEMKVGIKRHSNGVSFASNTHVVSINMQDRSVGFYAITSREKHQGSNKEDTTYEIEQTPIEHEISQSYNKTLIYSRKESTCPQIRVLPNNDIFISSVGESSSKNPIFPYGLTLKLTTDFVMCARFCYQCCDHGSHFMHDFKKGESQATVTEQDIDDYFESLTK